MFHGFVPKQVMLHNHPVIQLIIGMDGNFLQKGRYDDWTSLRSLLIAPNVSHQCDATGQQIFALTVCPESKLGQQILNTTLINTNYKELDKSELNKLSLEKIRNLIKEDKYEQLYHFVERFFYKENYECSSKFKLDERIKKVRQYITDNIQNKFDTKELCDIAYLSESRLLHLFKEQIGVPIRNYILWTRLKKAIEIIIMGESLTYAAHSVGFSDSSHMTKTFISNFGLNPTEIFKNSKFIQVSELIEA